MDKGTEGEGGESLGKRSKNGEKGEKRVQGKSPRCPSTTTLIKGVSL
jgi:hypothetical protein